MTQFSMKAEYERGVQDERSRIVTALQGVLRDHPDRPLQEDAEFSTDIANDIEWAILIAEGMYP